MSDDDTRSEVSEILASRDNDSPKKKDGDQTSENSSDPFEVRILLDYTNKPPSRPTAPFPRAGKRRTFDSPSWEPRNIASARLGEILLASTFATGAMTTMVTMIALNTK